MRPSRFPPQDAEVVEALVTDDYLDALLATAHRLQAADADAAGDADLDTPGDDLRHASAVIRASLLRVHPSFRFEERLAERLADLAASRPPRALAVGGKRHGEVIPFPGPAGSDLADPLLAAVLDGRLDPADAEAVARAAGLRSPSRPFIVGGAITSAALSLVGVAWVAWRASRPSGSTMARAAREAHARRLADIAELAPNVHGGPA